MSKQQILIVIGIWIIFFLFLGFPAGWDKILAIISGALIIIIAYSIKQQVKCCSPECEHEYKKDVPFVEHKSENINNSSIQQ